MKRSLMGLFGCLLATSALAQGPVYSVNIVGFNKHVLERGKLYMIATAFEDVGTDGVLALRANDVFGNQLPNGTTVNYYHPSSTNDLTPYDQDAKNFAGWSSNIVFQGFMGFWVKTPATPAGAPYELVMKGQVPMDGSSSNLVGGGLNMLGYPYTADVKFTNTGLFASSINGDQLFVWDGAITNYNPPAGFSKNFAGWGPATNLTLRMGVPFWYKRNSGSPILETEVRPYPPAN